MSDITYKNVLLVNESDVGIIPYQPIATLNQPGIAKPDNNTVVLNSQRRLAINPELASYTLEVLLDTLYPIGIVIYSFSSVPPTIGNWNIETVPYAYSLEGYSSSNAVMSFGVHGDGNALNLIDGTNTLEVKNMYQGYQAGTSGVANLYSLRGYTGGKSLPVGTSLTTKTTPASGTMNARTKAMGLPSSTTVSSGLTGTVGSVKFTTTWEFSGTSITRLERIS